MKIKNRMMNFLDIIQYDEIILIIITIIKSIYYISDSYKYLVCVIEI